MAIKVSNTTVIDDNKVFLPNNSSSTEADISIVSNSITLDLNAAAIFSVSLTNNITSITLSNIQSTGRTSSFVIIFTADGTARSVTWPASFQWPSSIAPTITSTNGKKDLFLFMTIDGGTTWQAFISGQNY
jgi:hypothetical protein